MRIFEILTYIGAAIGFILLVSTFGANGATQQAAGAAMALACVGIPYAITSVLQRRALLDQGKDPL